MEVTGWATRQISCFKIVLRFLTHSNHFEPIGCLKLLLIDSVTKRYHKMKRICTVRGRQNKLAAQLFSS